MKEKICFFRLKKLEELNKKYQSQEEFIQCDPNYIPANKECIIIFPYPFIQCYIIGDNKATCDQLFKRKFYTDFDTAQTRLKEDQKIVNQFIRIKESYEL